MKICVELHVDVPDHRVRFWTYEEVVDHVSNVVNRTVREKLHEGWFWPVEHIQIAFPMQKEEFHYDPVEHGYP